MRSAILLTCLLLAAACGRKQDVYIIAPGAAAPVEATATEGM